LGVEIQARLRLYSVLPQNASDGVRGSNTRDSRHPTLRSEFSTVGPWRDKKSKPEEKPAEEAQKQPESEEGKKPEKEVEGEDRKEQQDEDGKKNEKEGKKEKKGKNGEKNNESPPPPPPPPPHGDKSPLAVFMETLQTEFKKSQEWQESTKQLADSANQFTESPAVRKAREGYEKTASVAGKVGGKTAETLGKTASAVGQGVAWTWNTPVIKAGRTVVRKTGEGVAQVTKPVRETKVYKDVTVNIKEVIDDGSSSRYGGFLEREERKRQRERREKQDLHKKAEKFDEDPKYYCPTTGFSPTLLTLAPQRGYTHNPPQRRQMERILARIPRQQQVHAIHLQRA
jgi:import inner membrane translocase subunit TIM44